MSIYWFRVIFNLSSATECVSFTKYRSLNPRKFILHAWKDPLIFAELTHYLFIAPYDRTQRRTKVSIWKQLWPLKIWNKSQQPTFYAIHAVSLGWFSFTATKHLPGQLHFQEKLCKIQAYGNTQETKTQPCSKWRRLDWTLPWRHQLQPIIFTREGKQIFTCVYVAVCKYTREKFHELIQKQNGISNLLITQIKTPSEIYNFC